MISHRAALTVLLTCCAVFAGASSSAAQTPGTYPGCYPGEYPGYPGEYPCVPTCPTGVGVYPDCGVSAGDCPAGTTGTPPNCTAPGGGTPPPPPPPPPAAPTTTTAGTTRNARLRLSKARRFRVDSLGRVKLGTAACPLDARQCRPIRLRFERPGRPAAKSFALATVTVKPGQLKTLRLKLASAPRRTLRRKGSLRTRLVIRRPTLKAVIRTVTVLKRR